MAEHILSRSKTALRVELYLILGVTVGTALLAFLLFRFFYRATPSTRWYVSIFAFIIVALIGYGAMLLRQKKWREVQYKLTPHAILITPSSGLWSTSQEVYLYESIISASLTQNYFGKKYGYGDIELVIPKLDSAVSLTALEVPEDQLKLLKTHLQDKVHRQTLVT